LRGLCDVIATFEDLGSGADAADLVFNELYTDARADGIRRFSGPEVACLREEFYSLQPRPVADAVGGILITFGGTDSNNLTLKALRALDQVEGRFRVNVVLGLGYRDVASLEAPVRESRHEVQVYRNVRNISTLMAAADLAITSAGRTVFELIACQTPVLAMAQNARETMHTCTDERYGVVGLGLGEALAEASIADAVRGLLPKVPRARARQRMAAVDLWNGPDRIMTAIMFLLRARRLRT
jgi:spore coat polysaccharide biosynthesis predicted glycosyltransferase SpsG